MQARRAAAKGLREREGTSLPQRGSRSLNERRWSTERHACSSTLLYMGNKGSGASQTLLLALSTLAQGGARRRHTISTEAIRKEETDIWQRQSLFERALTAGANAERSGSDHWLLLGADAHTPRQSRHSPRWLDVGFCQRSRVAKMILLLG